MHATFSFKHLRTALETCPRAHLASPRTVSTKACWEMKWPPEGVALGAQYSPGKGRGECARQCRPFLEGADGERGRREKGGEAEAQLHEGCSPLG